MLRFRVGDSIQELVLTDQVLEHFERHRQLKHSDTEAGGQLFARVTREELLVETVTGPRPTDRRTRTSYHPDRTAEQREIKRLYKKGLHYVGDWHTHPASIPVPSSTDIESIVKAVARSQHDLYGFVLIIVGTEPAPSGLRVAVHHLEGELVLQAHEATPEVSRQRSRSSWLKQIFGSRSSDKESGDGSDPPTRDSPNDLTRCRFGQDSAFTAAEQKRRS